MQHAESVFVVCMSMVSGLTTFHWPTNKRLIPGERPIGAQQPSVACNSSSRGGAPQNVPLSRYLVLLLLLLSCLCRFFFFKGETVSLQTSWCPGCYNLSVPLLQSHRYIVPECTGQVMSMVTVGTGFPMICWSLCWSQFAFLGCVWGVTGYPKKKGPTQRTQLFSLTKGTMSFT